MRDQQTPPLPTSWTDHPEKDRIHAIAKAQTLPDTQIAPWYRAVRTELDKDPGATDVVAHLERVWSDPNRPTLTRRGKAVSSAPPPTDKTKRTSAQANKAAPKANDAARKAWEKDLIHADAAAQALGLTPGLFEAYVREAGFAPDLQSPLPKRGRNALPHRYHPLRITNEAAKVVAWQALRAENARMARKAMDAAQKDQVASMGLLATPERFGIGAAPFARRIVFHCGPTNSGKTYGCFETLRAAGSGVYAGPLRLLALEGWRALGGENGACRLVTGEERRGPLGAALVSCTIETLDMQREVEVAVLDEIQMLGDPHRGWAWTQALLSVRAHTVLLAGSIVALPWIKAVLARTGETLEIVEHTRPTPLEIALEAVHTPEPGDAVVTFSRRSALSLRNRFLESGATVALIYGGLPAEVREAEARRFANGEADVLVATDAIGMGLNLPIKRVLFAAFRKFDGIEERALLPEELRQIAGRAGRRGFVERGMVGAFGTQPPLNWLSESLQPPQKSRAKARPWWRPMENLDPVNWYKDLRERAKALANPQTPFQGAFDAGLLERAAHLSRKKLPLDEAMIWLGAPADPDDAPTWSIFTQAVDVYIGRLARVTIPNPPAHASTQSGLEAFDSWARQVTLLRWLDARWEGQFLDVSALENTWRTGTQRLAQSLAEGAPMLRTCSRCAHPLPSAHTFAICEPCHQDGRAALRDSASTDEAPHLAPRTATPRPPRTHTTRRR